MSDDVNDYGLGAPNTQPGESVDRGYDEDEGMGLEHGLGPSEGPFVGESAPEEEGLRHGLGDENTQDADVVDDPGAESPIQHQPTAQPDPLEHGLESTDLP